jgi:AAA domain, putative AbiEii toxin, Type IV TA system
MLKRLYIDNFRCFVNFEYCPARRQLILGRNGSGKSSLLDALLNVRQFIARGDRVEDHFPLSKWTKWLSSPKQTFEIEVGLNATYVYRLELEPVGEPPKPQVALERVELDGKVILEFAQGEVRLQNGDNGNQIAYPLEPDRSALATVRSDNRVLTDFKQWISRLYCFRLNPFAMTLRADGENLYPNVDLSNIAAWYRHLTQAYPSETHTLLSSLRTALDDFNVLILEPAGENVRVLVAEFGKQPGTTIRVGFNQLSDGQRCLICLYIVLHFVLAKGSTVILDEPDNFVALPEIQPWLMEVADTVDEGRGQILVISHHPELINQWALDCGVQLVRDGTSAVRAQSFTGDPGSPLSPSELIARGWERG